MSLYVYTRVYVCVYANVASSFLYTYLTNQSEIIVNNPKQKKKKQKNVNTNLEFCGGINVESCVVWNAGNIAYGVHH